MTAPTPAAVRAAMKTGTERLTEEEGNALRDDLRFFETILRDHIRAIAEDMRNCANLHRDCGFPDTAKDLSDFADRLEGRES